METELFIKNFDHFKYSILMASISLNNIYYFYGQFLEGNLIFKLTYNEKNYCRYFTANVDNKFYLSDIM